MRVSARFLPLLIVFEFAPPVAAAETCPLNTVIALDASITTSEPSRGLSGVAGCSSPYGGRLSASAGYNLVLGAGNAYASSSGLVCSTSGSASTHDAFKLVGPGSPNPLVFMARLSVGASWTSYSAHASASLREGDSNSQSYSSGTGQPTSMTLSVTITRAVGDSFDLYMVFSAFAFSEPYSESSSISGTLSFAGLPAGYAVVSCQGYVSDPTVPVRPTSWGRLKAIYR